MSPTFLRRQRAFTIVEIMVVLLIIGILAATILPNVVGKSDRAKRVKARADVTMIESFLDQFYLDMDRYPTTEEGLHVLYEKPEDDAARWGGPYPAKRIPKDPWKNPYVYEYPASRSDLQYDLFSRGRDGEEGGEAEDADVTNWMSDEDDESEE